MVPSFGEYPRRFNVQESLDRPFQERAGTMGTVMFEDDLAISGTVEAATREEVEQRLSRLQSQSQSLLASAVAEAWRLLCRRRYAP
eukprot:s699_g7.t1